MKTNEVRQGNYAYYKYWNPNPSNPSWEFEVVEIVGVLKETFYFKLKNDKRTHKIGELHPIPLNEEWLLKMGFKLSYTSPRKCFIYKKNNVYLEVYLYKNGRIDLEITKTIFEAPKYRNRYVKNMYLHEYQNLVFSITGEELTINEK